MSEITKVDSNFNVETNISEKDIRFYSVLNAPFKVYGLIYENERFRRMPEEAALSVSKSTHELHTHTAGGRLRFKTDSSYVAINTKMPCMFKMPHFAFTGTASFDLYSKEEEGERYIKTFVAPLSSETGYESIIYFEDKKMREITINFPPYSTVKELYVGLQEGAAIEEPTPYKHEKPIVYYGSSITQGGCTSRPGNIYQNIISRRFSTDYINLGFSGSALAEEKMADYIAGLDMSVFVYDYDFNAPTPEYLKETHEKMFLKIREKHPTLPIVMMSRPRYFLDNDAKKRLEVIKETYNNALANGDKNVYLLDGPTLMAKAKGEGTVDNTHPNDLGFASIAKALGDVLEQILK